MLVSHQERPRELKWYHAGPMLYGDWGTSRFYVLGLAFYYALYASFWYILGVGILVAAVGWAYTVVCRVYPDGGGVYSAARQLSPLLSVIGALLLFADYAVTAALSAFDGMHYMGFSDSWVRIGALVAILILGLVNYIGPKRAGTFALVVAMATLLLTIFLVIFAIPHLPAGWAHIRHPTGPVTERWSTLVNVVLALSGVEAIANMTGIMVLPVARTAKKSIWPVLLEVVIFNLVLGVAMLALPAMLEARGAAPPTAFTQPAVNFQDQDGPIQAYRDSHLDWDKEGKADYEHFLSQYDKKGLQHSTPAEEAIKNKVLRVMGEEFIGHWFGVICGVVFGLLLLSAVNTVLGGMLSVCYVMARDTELPGFFKRLNLFGVPWYGLLPAVLVPCLLLLLFHSIESLADLYAIGVVGAIAINLTCCTINPKLEVRKIERVFIGGIALVMIGIELTLAWQKIPALIFVTIILGIGLGARFFTKSYLPARARGLKEIEAGGGMVFRGRRVSAPSKAAAGGEAPLLGTPATELDMSRPHIMVATRGGQRLIDFAASYAKQLEGLLFVLYVRQLNVQFAMGAQGPTLAEDAEARHVFESAAKSCEKLGVQMVPIYVVSRDVGYTILDFAATYDVRALLMGVSREGAVLRALRGDVLTQVADGLPQDIPLLIHA
ncbi:MAG TPA: universal stress protein [Phycisphaerae bacterium]|nr:universal stress protein [Phycisphaerae bacterium]